MSSFSIEGLPSELTDEVRSTLRSPGYGHPVVRDIAQGTGPCRSCFGLFDVGREERLLFTYRPSSGSQAVGAPGPVFIHSRKCGRYEEDGFPDSLRELPLFFEGRSENGRVVEVAPATAEAIDDVIDQLLASETVDFLFVRHREAGCHIGRIDPV